MLKPIQFCGSVVTGRGEAAAFTRLEWVREQFLDRLAIDPYPGTLNLTLAADSRDLEAWRQLQASAGHRIEPATPLFCAARCYPVRLNDALPAGIVIPEVPDYPSAQVELVAAVSIRDALHVADGDRVVVEESGPLPVRAVIFDVDGTLVDSLPAFRIVAERAAAPYGVTITDALVRDALNCTRPFWDLALPSDFADRERMIEMLREETARIWPDVLREHGRLAPAATPALDALRDGGAMLGITTGAGRGSLDALRRAGLLDRFAAVVTGDDVAQRKPDPEGLLTCASRLGVQPHEAAYVGDTPLDVEAARAAGMASIGVLGGAGDSALLSAAGAHRLIRSLERLPQAVTM